MADGSAQICQPSVIRDLLGSDGVLVASCLNPACGAQAVVASAAVSGLRQSSITRLEDELRCVCGARRGRLSSRPFWGPQPALPGGIYLFVS